MDWEELFAMTAIFVVTVIPVFGITARFALIPLFETLVRLREASARDSAASDVQIARLTDEVQRLAAAVERIEEGSDFDRQIRRSASVKLPPND